MENRGYLEVKKILDWYIESEVERDEIIGLMDYDIDPSIYLENLKYFLKHSMNTMVLLVLLRGRWANRDISDIVIRAVIRFVVEKWDEKSLEELAWEVVGGVQEYILENEEDEGTP